MRGGNNLLTLCELRVLGAVKAGRVVEKDEPPRREGR